VTRETLGSAPASAHPSGGAPRWRSAALFLGVATALGHALSYAFSLVLSRALGPADFGALGALLGVAVVATVPATALQTQVARFAAVGYHAAGARQSHRLSWWVGLGQGLLLAVLALPLTAALRLDTGLGVLLLGAGLLPTSVIAARQGALLGRGEFGLLATTMVLVPALRLVGAGVAAASDMGVAGAIGMQTVATWVALAAVAVIVRPASDAAVTAADDMSVVPRMAGVLTSSAGLLGLFVLANVDVLLARMFLSDAQSGVYAVGALGAKLMFWGSQFVALLVFPRVARRESGRAVLALPGMVVAGIGVAATVASTWLAAPVLDLLVGPAYAEAAGHFPWFVALGTLLALVQLQTYAAVAVDAHRASVLLWFSVAVLAAVVALAAHDDVRDIVGAAIAAAGLLVVANTVLVWRTRS
jgi:O-antigen/teichoic acid export membrane protein